MTAIQSTDGGDTPPSKAARDPILRLDALVKRFGTQTVLHEIGLDIHDGEFLTIVGPSGSGKTTLIRLLVGMEEPTSGAIWLRGRRIERVPAHQRPTCMVFQSLALFPHRTVGQNIEFSLKIKGIGENARRERALELMDLLHLPEAYYSRGVTQISGGERQRVALARALAFDPEILFFDEPLSALDYRLRKTLERELKDLHQRTGKTFVYITHSLEEAMVMSDRIAIMRDGRFEQIGPGEDIYERPESRFVASFMGEVNLFDIERGHDGALTASGLAIHVAGDPPKLDNLLPRGRKGALMVRPEFVRFLDPGEPMEFTAEGVLHGEYALGSRIQYQVERPDGTMLTIEKLREDRFAGAPGTPVRLGWDLAHAHLIDEV